MNDGPTSAYIVGALTIPVQHSPFLHMPMEFCHKHPTSLSKGYFFLKFVKVRLGVSNSDYPREQFSAPDR